MNILVGDYVLVHSVEDADGIDSDDMNSFIGHVGVVIEAIQEPGVVDDEQLVLVRFPGTGGFGGFFEPFGGEILHVKGSQCFTQMTFYNVGLRLIARPGQPITEDMFSEGGL